MNTEGNGALGEDDVREIVRLLGDVAGLEESFSVKRNWLMNGLAKLIQADYWAWSMFGEIDTSKNPSHTIFLHGGFTEEQFAKYLQLQEHPDLQWMTAPFLQELTNSKNHITRLQQQMVAEEKLAAAPIMPLLAGADLGPIVLSGRTTESGQISVISLFRKIGRPLFDPREAKIAHILLSEVTWLHELAWPKHPRSDISALTPRLRTILGFLLLGKGRKQIADTTDLSIHTVNDYIKAIYESFDVHTQPELIRRFTEGDGGDSALPPT